MTRKQMKKLAKEIYDCELIHSSKTSSTEEKSRAEKRIMSLTNQIAALPDGINIMLEVDTFIQQMASKDKEI